MSRLSEFLSVVRAQFPADRLTLQNQVPVFHPESTEEAADLFRLANQHRQPLFIAGFSNNIVPSGEKFEGLVTVRTDRLNQLLEINSKDLYVRVGAGFPLGEINLSLRERNLFVPHANLPYPGSVGGALAVGLTAELGGHDLPLKKFFLKADIVTPVGEIISPGSVCFKSTSGYDVVKLFARSWGLLGLIATATLRTVPASAADEYESMHQKAIEREHFLAGLAESNAAADAVYSRKVKVKFDPAGVLPII